MQNEITGHSQDGRRQATGSGKNCALLPEEQSRGILIRFPRRLGRLIPFPLPSPATGGAA